jgi:hypothetical protein
MKKIITLFIALYPFIANAQCPTPSNLTYNYINSQDVQLNWTENGTANSWDITVVPNFYVGAPLPTDSYSVSSANSFTFANFPITGCYAFFVRSVCSVTDVSPWVAVGSSGCDTNIYNYLATLSTNTHNLESSAIQVYPNPSKNSVQIKSTSKIDKITVFDSLGKVILTQTQSTNEINLENFSKGIYFIEIFTESGKMYKKIIKE